MAPGILLDENTTNRDGLELEETSDQIDAVNVLKGSDQQKFDSESKFDEGKDKTKFRQYEDACDRVKNFYREQHGAFRVAPLLCTAAEMSVDGG